MPNRGYTTIELILVIVLLGLVTAMSVPMLLTGFRAYFQERETTGIERQAMVALERMSREIRPGTDIVTAGSTVTFNRGGGSTEIGYDSGANTLYLNRGGAGSHTLAQSVTGASFTESTYEDARYVEIQFSVAGSTQSWRSTIYPRNDQ